MKHALTVQQRVISAIIYRELKTRFGHHKLGVLWLLLEPLMHMLVLTALWSFLGKLGPAGIPDSLYLTTGIIPFLFYRTTVMRILPAISSNKTLLIFPQIRIMDLIVARLLIEIIAYIVLMVSILTCLWLAGLPVSIANPGELLTASIILWFAALSTGIFCIPLNALFPVTEKILGVAMRLIYVASGAMFNIQLAPYSVRPYMLANPLFHIIYMIRHSIFVEIPYVPEFMSYSYVLLVFSLMFLLGYTMIWRFRLQLLGEQ